MNVEKATKLQIKITLMKLQIKITLLIIKVVFVSIFVIIRYVWSSMISCFFNFFNYKT
jgi:hypothetical protein